MTDNYLDVDFYKKGTGWVISIHYWYYNRNPDREKRKITSMTSYTWYKECQEIIDLLLKKRTKVFYSQIRVLARNYGKKEKSIF